MTLHMLALTFLVATTTTAASSTSKEDTRDQDVTQLGARFLVDVTYEKRSFDGSVIVNLRTIGPSHDSDTRQEFPRDDMQMVIQGAKGAVVFESGLPWKDTGEKTIEGHPAYTARILVHPDMKDGLILTESLDGFDDKPMVGIVTFHSLFKR
ncbi:hypothetical protein [Rubripirellula reticaptiva]|uniref:Uncharacterized protein n=1 Tax=Rubripirellula reticaptiva TaxID=2528013 RepID=A0A5C6E7C0_9BACT|nr:hypothetical protein [Rubripirellula reticaptiva]TWU44484.1 hypothetical protein Poly59_61560 [Rubripirellula reticaptiva]